MKEKIYRNLPVFFQELLISIFNFKAYRIRYGGRYSEFYTVFLKNLKLTKEDLLEYQSKRFFDFVNKARRSSLYYNELYKDFKGDIKLENLKELPIINKESLRKSIKKVHTISYNKGVVSKTGGTTGKSLEVLFTRDNMQERFAMLDNFRANYGYKLGKRTAWFSGKNILTKKDLKNKRFWKTDYFHNVRYYSTFHIKEDYLDFYIKNLIEYKPKYFVGFPSTMLDIANYGLKKGYDFPKGIIKAIFPTAETVNFEMRKQIELFFKTRIINQYASSEGAPFIFECGKGNLHLELQSGVFEVLDENNNDCNSGQLVVTSFTTEGTPLIRYNIGDSIILDDPNKSCVCGNNNPLVREIIGRIDDFIYSPENGKINLGNVSNTLKNTKGILKFQVLQSELNSIIIKLVVDKKDYNENIKSIFLRNWRNRVGDKMKIKLQYVNKIEVEKSGKFRIVKNEIKHLL